MSVVRRPRRRHGPARKGRRLAVAGPVVSARTSRGVSSGMRDLASRLRSIVRQDHGGASPAPRRELTYVPDTDGLTQDPSRAARALGGTALEAHGGGCIVIDRVWESHESHG